MASEEVIQSIVGCARCHGDGHENLRFEPLTHSTTILQTEIDGVARPVEITHWAPCPTNGEPILMTIVKKI